MTAFRAQILALSAGELADAVRSGAIAAVEATQAYLEQIDATAARLRAYVRVTPERALAEAAAVDAARTRGAPLGPLAGVPYGLKDILVTAGIATEAGSRILAGWVPPYDGWHARRLRLAGAVLLGKLALDEFAMGSHGDGPGGARNPWSLGHVPGGSSSGSAVAVAGRAAAVALGSDTGGSLRVPAARCGLVGVRPTWGRVSRAGLVAFASSLDAVGPLARSVDDAARVLACLAGHDPEDSTSIAAPVPDYPAMAARGRARGLEGVRIGFDPASLEGIEPAVAEAFAAALSTLAGAGATIVEVALPPAGPALTAYAALSAVEAVSNLARYDGARYGLSVPADSYEATAAATRGAGFGLEVKRRLVLGALVLRSPELLAKAQAARARTTAQLLAALAHCDAIASPTCAEAGVRARAAGHDLTGSGVGEAAAESARVGAGEDVRRDRSLEDGRGDRSGLGVSRDRLLEDGRGDRSAESDVREDRSSRKIPGGISDASRDSFAARVIADLEVDRFTVAASLAGLPALSLPAGLGQGSPALPIGLHLVGPRLGEGELLAIAAAFEAATPWRARLRAGPEGT